MVRRKHKNRHEDENEDEDGDAEVAADEDLSVSSCFGNILCGIELPFFVRSQNHRC